MRHRAGARPRHRAPLSYRPADTYFWGGLLLCFTVGLVAAGVHESYVAGDWYWFTAFMLGEAGCFVLYFLNVYDWLRWMNRTPDYTFVCSDVACPHEYEHDQHPGRH
jgi:hypothetical protein